MFEPPWLPIDTCLIDIWVTVKVVPVSVAFAGLETTKELLLGMDVIVTVSELVVVAVNVSVVLVVAGAVNVKVVALLTDVATVSLAGMPVPEITVPARNETGVAVVTVVLPLVMVAVKVEVVVVVLGIPVPVTVMPMVKALVEVVSTVVLPLVVFAVMVEDAPDRLIQGLFELWQATQKVGLVETLYWLVPRLGAGDTATPLMVTLESSPSWL